MTVKELIKKLQEVKDDEAEVIIHYPNDDQSWEPYLIVKGSDKEVEVTWLY